MKRIITLALLGLTLTGGVAMADRDGRDRRQDRRQDRREFRQEQRQDRRAFRQDMRQDRARHRQDMRQDRRRWDRGQRVVRNRPVYRNNTFYFDSGVTRVYRAPTPRYRYRNYYQRPVMLVENYDPMPGYIWISGAWNWNGVEWIWSPGHYDVDVNYYSY